MDRPTTSSSVSPLARFQARVHSIRRKLRISETAWLFILAALSGVLAGLGSIAFHYLIAFFQGIFFGSLDRQGPLSIVTRSGYPWTLVLAAPALGGLVVGPLIWRFAREAKGHGVPAVVRAVHERGGRISPVVAVVKTFASAITLGSGGSLGREGPVVQIGASIGSSVGQLLGVTPKQMRMLAAGGAAAGLAAIFNAPLGGAFFALEVILGSFAMDAFGPVVVASVAATVVSRGIMGDHAVIDVPQYKLEHSYELLIYAGLGVACALVAVALTRGVALGAAVFERIPIPDALKPVIGGLATGALAILVTPRVLGNGYETVDALISGQTLEKLAIIVLVAKLAATCLSLGSGQSGGLFGPSLFLGAATGSIFGKYVGFVLPVGPRGAYALVGMGALVAGATHAPISMVLMLFEMSDDYQIVLPLLIASSVASVLARKLYPESIDTVLDARRGVRVHKGIEEMALHAIRVEEATRLDETATVRPGAPFSELVDRFLRARQDVLAVTTEDGRYGGVILLADIRDALAEPAGSLARAVIAHDLARSDVPVLSPDMELTRAIDAFHGHECDALPVVRADGRFAGFLTDSEIVAAYRATVLRTELHSAIFTGDDHRSRVSRVELPQGVSVGEADAPAWLVGKTLAQVDARRRYGLNVLAIKARDGAAVKKKLPDPQAPIEAGERLVFLAPATALAALERGDEPPLASRETAEAVASASQRIKLAEEKTPGG